MNSIDKKAQNEKNILDAINFREPEKVPVGVEALSYTFGYAGVKYKDIMNDPQACTDANIKFFQDVPIDYMWMPAGMSRPVAAYNDLGCDNFFIAPDGCTIAHAQAKGIYMQDDEYDEFIKDPYKFGYDTLLKRKIPSFTKDRKSAYEDLIKALIDFKPFQQMNDLIKKSTDELGISVLTANGPKYDVPLDFLFDKVRGMRNTIMDLRRRPKLVEEACDRIFEINMSKLKKPEEYDGVNNMCIGLTCYHSACFLNSKHFDRFFMHYLEKGFMPYIDRGVRIFLKGEGNVTPTLHKFRDMPKASMIIMLESDDPFEAYKLIGDHQVLACGISNNMMKYEDKETCVDYVKKCFDTFAPGGGYMFLNDRSLLGAQDALPENVRAVYNFAEEYSRGGR